MTATLEADGFVVALDELVAEMEASEDPARIVEAIVHLRNIVRLVREAAAQVEHRYCAIAPKRVEVPGIGLVQVKHHTKRTGWDHAEVLRRVVAAARDEQKIDSETGEVLEDAFSAAARVIAECASFSWKVTALRPRGIDPDQYCHLEVDAPAVTIGVA